MKAQSAITLVEEVLFVVYENVSTMQLTETVIKNILNLGFFLEEMVILLSRKE